MKKKIKLWWVKRTFNNHRLGSFWCDDHWNVIRKSLDDSKPIHPAIAALGITEALWLKEVLPEKVIMSGGRACCWVQNLDVDNKGILEGIFERSRNYGFGI